MSCEGKDLPCLPLTELRDHLHYHQNRLTVLEETGKPIHVHFDIVEMLLQILDRDASIEEWEKP